MSTKSKIEKTLQETEEISKDIKKLIKPAKPKKSNLKIIWHSVAPFVRSGYGNVTRFVTSGIKNAGYDILVSAYYGVEPGGIIQVNNVPVLASKRGPWGEVDYKYYWNSTRRNFGILMTDFWAFQWFPGIHTSCSSSPLDHEDYPPELQEYIKSYDYIVTLSKWTQKELAKFGCKSTWIPHGINLDIFKPIDKIKARQITGLPQDKYIQLTVAANCYDEQTEVLTIDGWKYFNDICYNDRVATLKKDHYIEYHKPNEIIQQDYNGKMYKVHNKCVDLLVTPNHKMYVKRKEYNKLTGKSKLGTEYRREKAIDIIGKQRWYKKNAKWLAPDLDYFVLPEYIPKINTDRQYIELRINMDNWLEFFGYYLAEGHSNGYRVSIKQSKSKHPEKFAKIKKCLEKLPFGFSISKREKEFEINDVQLATYLKQFGKSYEKYIPNYIKMLSSRQLRILFDAMMLGDGCIRDNVWTYTSSSKKLRDDMQEICLKIGYAGDYVTIPEHEQYSIISKKNIHVREHYTITIKRKQVEPRNRQAWSHIADCFEEGLVDYSGKVYCVNVQNHVIYVRRNGKTVWSCNSDKETRKSWYENLDAIKLFTDNNPDVKDFMVVFHTNPVDPRGVNLQLAVKKRGLQNIVKLENPFQSNTGILDEEMSLLYNSADVMCCPSKREGFGMCFYESMGCGVPCIGHDFSALPEAIKGRGWLAKTKMKTSTPINAVTAHPDVEDIAKCIADAYFHPEKREKYGNKSLKFAQKYSWNSAINKWVDFLQMVENDMAPKELSKRQLV